jgi:hypothetical protein
MWARPAMATLAPMRSPLPLRTLLLAVVAACALAPAAAHAAVMTQENGGLVYRGEGSEGLSLLVSSYEDNGVKYLSMYDSGADRIAYDGTGCFTNEYAGSGVFYCPMPSSLRIEGSDGKDSISIFSASDVPDSMAISIDGKGGDDQIKDAYDGQAGRTLLGGPGNDTVIGYGGDDTIDGGDGNDTVDGGEGNDVVRGGAGDDVLWGDHYQSPGADVIDGGPGVDQIDEWTIPGGDVHPLPTVTQDGVADDGRPGEGDNVTNVEKFQFHITTTFKGSDADETVEVLNVDEGSSNLDGGGGNDVLKAYDMNDTVSGGPGDDRLEGGLGNDTVTGGPGKDTIMGDASSSYCSYLGSCKVPFGNDTIYAQDGEVDQIDCGIGEDTAYVDPIDVVTNCETVIKGAGGPAPAAGQPAPSGSAARATLTLIGTSKLKTLLAGRLTVGVPCSAACRVSVTARSRGKTVATGRATLLSAGTAKVKLKVAKKARTSVKRAKSLNVTLTATITTAGGKPQKLTRSLALKK